MWDACWKGDVVVSSAFKYTTDALCVHLHSFYLQKLIANIIWNSKALML